MFEINDFSQVGHCFCFMRLLSCFYSTRKKDSMTQIDCQYQTDDKLVFLFLLSLSTINQKWWFIGAISFCHRQLRFICQLVRRSRERERETEMKRNKSIWWSDYTSQTWNVSIDLELVFVCTNCFRWIRWSWWYRVFFVDIFSLDKACFVCLLVFFFPLTLSFYSQ